MENKGESDHFLEILENLEILEILEIPPVTPFPGPEFEQQNPSFAGQNQIRPCRRFRQKPLFFGRDKGIVFGTPTLKIMSKMI